MRFPRGLERRPGQAIPVRAIEVDKIKAGPLVAASAGSPAQGRIIKAPEDSTPDRNTGTKPWSCVHDQVSARYTGIECARPAALHEVQHPSPSHRDRARKTGLRSQHVRVPELRTDGNVHYQGRRTALTHFLAGDPPESYRDTRQSLFDSMPARSRSAPTAQWSATQVARDRAAAGVGALCAHGERSARVSASTRSLNGLASKTPLRARSRMHAGRSLSGPEAAELLDRLV